MIEHSPKIFSAHEGSRIERLIAMMFDHELFQQRKGRGIIETALRRRTLSADIDKELVNFAVLSLIRLHKSA